MTDHEPGTVAVATVSGAPDVRVMRLPSGLTSARWASAKGFPHCLHEDRRITDVRPLAVIDPEDSEQVSVLARSLGRLLGDIVTTSDTQAALREFADPKPPKPAEPTGLGAVVEATCRCGGPSRFVYEPQSDRFEMWTSSKGRPWKSACGHHEWSDLTAVEILSEGVPS